MRNGLVVERRFLWLRASAAVQYTVRAVRAVLSVLPLDTFVEAPAMRMEVAGDPQRPPAVQREAQAEVNAAEGRDVPRLRRSSVTRSMPARARPTA